MVDLHLGNSFKIQAVVSNTFQMQNLVDGLNSVDVRCDKMPCTLDDSSHRVGKTRSSFFGVGGSRGPVQTKE